jgi:hypothetical protein
MGRSQGVIFALPHKVRIIGAAWTVTRVVPQGADENLLGWTHVQSRTIFVRPDLTRAVAEQVFAHELIHATLMDTGTHNVLSDKQQEMLSDALVPLILAVRRGLA